MRSEKAAAPIPGPIRREAVGSWARGHRGLTNPARLPCVCPGDAPFPGAPAAQSRSLLRAETATAASLPEASSREALLSQQGRRSAVTDGRCDRRGGDVHWLAARAERRAHAWHRVRERGGKKSQGPRALDQRATSTELPPNCRRQPTPRRAADARCWYFASRRASRCDFFVVAAPPIPQRAPRPITEDTPRYARPRERWPASGTVLGEHALSSARAHGRQSLS